jgi:murein DD-endopeptidase MepM/ murein hydrolase activator NlpD
MERQIVDYSKRVTEFNATLLSLKKAEKDLHALLSLGSKRKIMDEIDTSDMGAFDINQVQQQIESSMQTVGAIKDYLRTQKDLYLATPRGWPVSGSFSSPYGGRTNPITGRSEFHRGVDISAGAGTPVTATAEGVVSFAGWNGGGGNLVAITHGQGYVTYYAHNSKIAVEVGQRVRRGDVISYVGSTGSSTGSHCHYEVWHDGKSQNPLTYLEDKS